MSGDRGELWQSGFSKIPGPTRRTPELEKGTGDGHEAPAPEATRELHVVRPDGGRPHGVPAETAEAPAHPAATVAAVPAPDRGDALSLPPAPTPTHRTVPAAPVAPEPSPAPARSAPVNRGQATGRSVSASQVRAERAANEYAGKTADALAGRGVVVEVLEAELTGERFHLVVRATDRDIAEVLDNADAIADALGVEDVHCSSEGDRVHVWAAVGPATGTRSSAVWVPMLVRDTVRAERERTGETMTTVVLTAFNKVAGADGSGLLGLFPEHTEPAPGPMTIAPRKVRANVETPVQLWLYLDSSQEAVLDQAVTRTGAGSRSALMTRVLESAFALAPAAQ